MTTKKTPALHTDALLHDLRGLIEETRATVATTVNAALSLLYWQIGKRINAETLHGERATYGAEILPTVSAKLVLLYGVGFNVKNLHRMVQFAKIFPDDRIVATLSRQLSWSHFVEILTVKDALARDFYAEMCRMENWSVRTLRGKIGSMLFERTALSRKPEKLIELELEALRQDDLLTPDLVFRDPYFLDFLGLKEAYQEKDLEAAILRELESFILELGTGFSFVSRQKRIILDGDDFYLDLLFYHRDLRRLVVIELKLDKFKPEHKGQMELYLRWLDRYERKQGEESPLGIILCASKNDERVELLELDTAGIHVAEYLTTLPPKELLQKKLHAAIDRSKQQFEQRLSLESGSRGDAEARRKTKKISSTPRSPRLRVGKNN
jgi:predicted nuclease of restriction endonuclease-like (RecB) superfamily